MKYIVTGQRGQYAEREVWVIAAYDNKKAAEDHARAAGVIAKKWPQFNDVSDTIKICGPKGQFLLLASFSVVEVPEFDEMQEEIRQLVAETI